MALILFLLINIYIYRSLTTILFMKNSFKHLIYIILPFAICVSCTEDEPNPSNNETDPELIDSSCGLDVVYRDNKSSNNTSTAFVDNGYGSDTVEYREYADSSLVYYMTFEYNSQNQVTLSKRFDMNDVLESEQTLEYWPSGEKKMVKTVRKKLETLYDETNTTQESYYDENGNTTEYKNFSNSGSIKNHLVYTNTYEGGELVTAFRDDLIYSFDAILEYTYNSDGLIEEIITKNMDGEVTYKTVHEYSDGLHEVKRYSVGGTALSGSTKTFLNKNDIILKTQSLKEDGSIRVEHYFTYNCTD